jgi:hypothetical protein
LIFITVFYTHAQPWNTWVSCEELKEDGQIYQVDPSGQRPPVAIVLGSEGGRWESFAYNIRDGDRLPFFVIEDDLFGTLARFTSVAPDWVDPWSIPHGHGHIEYLILSPNDLGENGTSYWSESKRRARKNTNKHYPNAEGIDVIDNQLFFVCKNKKFSLLSIWMQ